MSSEASWQTGNAGREGQGEPSPKGPHMDQQTVESLLRRLVERVEESERRYGEALEELHTRLDRLSHTTEAARDISSPDEAETLGRLRDQVSGLARRLEQAQVTNPLDEFLELGKALSGKDFSVHSAENAALEPRAGAAYAPAWPEAAHLSRPTTEEHPAPMRVWPDVDEADLDKRLVDMAHRLEDSISAAMPSSEIAGLNARMDEIATRFEAALSQTPKLENLQHLERQLSEMGQQLGRAEVQIARIGGIETQLLRLIERFDEAPAKLDEVASKAANEAARLVASAETGKPSAAERLDAIHRDLVAMNDRSRATDDRLADTLAAVHESLKQLVQQVERGKEPQAPAPAPRPSAAPAKGGMPPAAPPKPPAASAVPPAAPPVAPAAPLAPPARFVAPPVRAEVSIEKAPAPKTGDGQEAQKHRSLRSRLGAAIPDFEEDEAPSAFGRAKRGQPEEAVDLDLAEAASRTKRRPGELETTEDFIAAARRAAQAAAAQAEERGFRKARLGAASPLGLGAELQGRRKRSLLMIAAALLLIMSAALLYGRLKSKPEAEAPPAQTEESAPAPAISLPPGAPEPGADAPAAPEGPHGTLPAAPDGMPPARSGESEEIPPAVRVSEAPVDTALADMPAEGQRGVSEFAKSRRHAAPEAGLTPAPQPVSLKPDDAATMLPGVTFSVAEPAKMPAPRAMADSAAAIPANLPMPPEGTGPRAVREAAAHGDAKAQFTIGLRYSEGDGIAQSWTEAARWFGFAAASGLAPAQYRLALLYERGLGVVKDAGKARSWYMRAAEQGNVKAMHNLGVAAGDLPGGKADYAAAAKWYAEAASYGLADSQFNLGVLEAHGLGVERNPAEAYKWFSLAAASGDAEAAKQRDLVKLQLQPQALAAAEEALKAWQAKPLNQAANEAAGPAQGAADASTNKALITRAQALLNKLGYDVGPPDGALGVRTRDAIKSFERRNGVAETGEVTVPLVTKLERLTS
jgi:localization factor PodJL